MDLPETCTIWNKGSSNGFGSVTWYGPFIVKCRIAYSSQKFTDTNGDQSNSTAVLYANSDELKSTSQVFFGSSEAITPINEANDVRQISKTPSGTVLKKAWFS